MLHGPMIQADLSYGHSTFLHTLVLELGINSPFAYILAAAMAAISQKEGLIPIPIGIPIGKPIQ